MPMVIGNYYRPQRSYEGYVFTGVCLSTGGRGLPGPGRCLLGGGSASQHALRQTPPPGRDGHCCGRYASYWNAFLFLYNFSSTTLFYFSLLVFEEKTKKRKSSDLPSSRLHRQIEKKSFHYCHWTRVVECQDNYKMNELLSWNPFCGNAMEY